MVQELNIDGCAVIIGHLNRRTSVGSGRHRWVRNRKGERKTGKDARKEMRLEEEREGESEWNGMQEEERGKRSDRRAG